MHELGIAMEIADLASERAGDARIVRVIVEVGELTAVFPDALAFAWEAAIAGEEGLLAGSTLEIVKTAGDELRIKALEVT